MKKRKLKRNVIIVACVLIVLIAFAIGYIVFSDLKQEDVLREEIAILDKKDITKDRYNTPIKTHGDYAKVEKAIKSYLDDYAVTLQAIMKLIDDDKLANMLTADNYQTDGPDFVNSKKYLTETKTSLNEKLTKLTNMTSTEAIMQEFNKEGLDEYYNDLYRELIVNDILEKDLTSAKTTLDEASQQINNLISTEEEIINLLVQNKGKWKIENNRIVFLETSALSQYNELAKKIAN